CPAASTESTVERGQRNELPAVHSITSSEQPVWNLEAERLCSFEVDNELEIGRLQHRHIGGLGTFQKATRVNSRLTVGILDAGGTASSFRTSWAPPASAFLRHVATRACPRRRTQGCAINSI